MIARPEYAVSGTPLAARAAELAERIRHTAPARPAWARLVAVSGVDASGKGTLARATAAALEKLGHRVAVVHLDDWHQPAGARFGQRGPAEHFYRNAFDFEEVFSQVIEPLRLHRTLQLDTERPHPFTGEPRRVTYDWNDIDTIIVEGIFLLRSDLRPRYDLSVWIDCSFETALARAFRRDQEGLAPEQLIADYRAIYLPAQQLHLDRDNPRAAAQVLIENLQRT